MDQRTSLLDQAWRDELATALLHDHDVEDAPLIRALVGHERAARDAAQDGCGDTLYALCFLLYMVGEPADAVLIHEVRRTSMDCGGTIDRDLLMMRSDRATVLAAIAAAAAADPTLATRLPGLRGDVEAAFDRPVYDTPADLEAALRGYFQDADG